MTNRKTIVLEKDLEHKIRKVQIQLMKDNDENISFSKTVNILLRRSLQ